MIFGIISTFENHVLVSASSLTVPGACLSHIVQHWIATYSRRMCNAFQIPSIRWHWLDPDVKPVQNVRINQGSAIFLRKYVRHDVVSRPPSGPLIARLMFNDLSTPYGPSRIKWVIEIRKSPLQLQFNL